MTSNQSQTISHWVNIQVMNWLAHTLLSKKNIHYQLGNVLADPLKGKTWKGADEALLHGMKMHRSIDKFTDKHPILTSSKARLGAQGHLKGVVLDILFDHYLSNNWQNYCELSLQKYLHMFNQQAYESSRHYPLKAKTIVGKMTQSNLLAQYQSQTDLVQALQRIDLRLSERTKAKETATQYVPVIEQQYEVLQADFIEFFPQLIDHFKTHHLGSVDNHYLW